VESLFDRIREVHPTKGHRRGQDHDITRLQTIHGLLVGLEPQEAAFFRHIEAIGLVFELMLQRFIAAIEFALEDIGHGDHFGLAVRHGEGLGGSPPSPTTGPDNRDLNGVAGILAKHMRDGDARESGNAGSFDKGAAGVGRGYFIHNAIV
jgi:hypothetical protein